MLRELSGVRVYIACGYTDLRMGIDGLAGTVQQRFHLDPMSKALFLFCGRRKDRVKGLLWEGDGYLLVYKRFEGGRLEWPRSAEEMRQLNGQEYRWLMEGLSIVQPKAMQEVQGQRTI